jgi:hypothetical protein
MEPANGGVMSYETWSTLLKVVSCTGAVFVLVSTFGLEYVNHQLDKVNDGKIDELVSGKNELLESVKDYKHQLEEKQKQIDELNGKAANASRGITKFRAFDGSYREAKTGFSKTVIGGSFEEEVFPSLNKLSEDKNWALLEVACTEVISKSPEWMTPYYFRGLARANLSKLDLAKSDLDMVFANVGDTPEYVQARKWLAGIEHDLAQTKK